MDEARDNDSLAHEGTALAEIGPPLEWPPSRDSTLPSIRARRTLIEISFLETGKLKVIIAQPGRALLGIETCPIRFTGRGFFRLALVWKARKISVYAGGECIASNELVSVQNIDIELKEDLPPIPNEPPADAHWLSPYKR